MRSQPRNLIKTLNVSGVGPSKTMSVFGNLNCGVQTVGFGSPHN